MGKDAAEHRREFHQRLGFMARELSKELFPQQKIVHAGVNSSSYQQGSRDLAELSDLKIAPKPVERIVRKIGQERID